MSKTKYDLTEKQKKKIYLIKSESFYKIGISSDPERRAKTIASSTPYGVRLIGTSSEYNNAETIEKELHQKFIDKSVGGEWFELDKGDVNFLKEKILIKGANEEIDKKGIQSTKRKRIKELEQKVKDLKEDAVPRSEWEGTAKAIQVFWNWQYRKQMLKATITKEQVESCLEVLKELALDETVRNRIRKEAAKEILDCFKESRD